MCCYSEKWEKKYRTHENKNEKPERRLEINWNYQQQYEQPTPSNEQAHHERYKNSTVWSYHREVTKSFQATSIYATDSTRCDR